MQFRDFLVRSFDLFKRMYGELETGLLLNEI